MGPRSAQALSMSRDMELYESPESQRGRCPFGQSFASDLWIAYHGTSDAAEAGIEQDGFAWRDDHYSRRDVALVLETFERLHWRGMDTGGFPVLASFSECDFRRLPDGQLKPTFFAETSLRALLYAAPDFSGGETARALRRSFGDLQHYLDSEKVRQDAALSSWRTLSFPGLGEVPEDCRPTSEEKLSHEHVCRLWKYRASRRQAVGLNARQPVEPIEFAETWLADRLRLLAPLRKRVSKVSQDFSHGVVYAVRFFKSDVPNMSYDHNGLAAHKEISPDRIVAKALLKRAALQADVVSDADQRLSVIRGDGIVRAVYCVKSER